MAPAPAPGAEDAAQEAVEPAVDVQLDVQEAASEDLLVEGPPAPPSVVEEPPAPTVAMDMPGRSPPPLMQVVDEEEEVEFCTPDVANDVEAAEAEPPFDPPDMEEVLDVEEAESDAQTADEEDGASLTDCAEPAAFEELPEDAEGAEPVDQLPQVVELEDVEEVESALAADLEPALDEEGDAAPTDCGEPTAFEDLAEDAEGAEPVVLEQLLQPEALEDDEEPPFDPMDAEELTASALSARAPSSEELVLTSANENARTAPPGAVRSSVPDSARDRPAPAIRIHLSWDRPDAAEFFSRIAADPRLSRAEITVERGGLDGAAVRCAAHQRPDLVVIDSTLRGAMMLTSLDRLMQAAGTETKVIILGAVNDVTLLRELAQRGVDEYMVYPVTAEDVVGTTCAMFAGLDKARVIAVIGARGGIGASTIAHNLAWSIAERLGAGTTLVDLDLPFGAAAFNFKLEPPRSLADVLDAGEAVNDVALEQVAIQRTERLTILPAPACPRRASDLQADTAQALVAAARRLSSYVVLDLPHMWAPWVREALLGADEVVLVSCPDIASLRNTDNMAKRIREQHKTDPTVVLSMTGVPKRPEVPLKEFAEALGITPACTFAFEPNIFGAAALTGQMLGEIAPGSKAAAHIDQLATLLTGRAPVEAPRPEPRVFEEPLPAEEQAEPAQQAEEVADPFETALVNPFALLAMEETVEEPPPNEPAIMELAPLELLELAPLEPDYIARARAVALEELDAIENPRHPQRKVRFGPFASVATGFTIVALAAGAYFFTRLGTAPAPASASATAAIEAPPPPPPAPTPQQMAADYEAAVQVLDQGDAPGAVARLRPLADAGFALAQYRLAKLYERGEGVEVNLTVARQWTERAAAAGNVPAMHDLGVYHARGEGAPRDEAAAFRLFEQAAEFGFTDSQFNLGILYEQGRGVEANAGEALFWFMLAAQQGDEAASDRVASLQAALTPFEIEQATARVAAFEPAPADPIANGVLAPPAVESADGEGSASVENPEGAVLTLAPTEG
jgi:pilus assembly protein CpaE